MMIRDQVIPVPAGPAGDPAIGQVLRAGALCNEATMQDATSQGIVGDPVDVALLRAAQGAAIDVERERAAYPLVNEIPFSSERKRMTTVHRAGDHWIAFCKGAPRTVVECCTSWGNGDQVEPLDDARRQAILDASGQLQEEGMYMLALAQKKLAAPEATEAIEQAMTFLGLQALIDPPRPEAAAAIAQAQGAGIRVVMITGDNARTAQAIAQELGIGRRTVESSEIERLALQALRERMSDVDIVARATPLTKQRILQALQEEGHFVTMTGDGVNDATALKQADVGVAMGLRGTDIARESASMVLLDDNFATIVAAIEEGRRIFDNIRKFTNYLLSTSLGEVFVVLALSLAGYFPLSAIMLLWVNVVTDLVPASALAADPAVPQVMQRRPRRHDEPILNKAIYATIAGSVLRTLIAYSLVFWVGLQFGGVLYARTMLFTSIVLHAFTRVMVVRQMDNLSLWSNRALLWSYAAAVGLQLLALYTPLRGLFGVIPLDWRAWAVMLPVVVGSSLAGVYMTRWILRLLPLWEEKPAPSP
jgi:Ca2+-transporting ATPase